MSSQSNSTPLTKRYDAGNYAKEEDASNAQNNGASQFIPRQTQPSSDTFEESLELSSLTTGEHRIYEYLQAHGWTENDCSIYFKNVRAMQEVLVQQFRAQGWSEGQLEAFDGACDLESPEQFSTSPATDYEWQVYLVEELNRRKRIGENMRFSNSTSATFDRVS